MTNYFTNDVLSISGEKVFLGQTVLGSYTFKGGDNILINDDENILSLDQDVSINTLCVNNDASFNGKLLVDGDVSLNNLSVDGDVSLNKLLVDGDVSLNSHLSVDGDVSLNNLSVDGDVSLNSHLSVDGDASLNNLYIVGELNANGGIAVNTNNFKVESGTGNTTIAGTLEVTGDTTLTGDLNANGGIAVNTNKFKVESGTGNTTIAGTLEVIGTPTLGNTKADNLFVSDDLSCNRLRVVEDASFTKAYIQDLTVVGKFDINDIEYNTVEVTNTVLLSTSIDISNQGTGPAIKVSQYGGTPGEGNDGDVAIFDAGSEGNALLIDKTGKSTFYMDVSCNKNVKIDGTLDVSGVATLIDASINNLIVEEISCNRLNISGPISLTSSTKLNLFGTKGAGPPNNTITTIATGGNGFAGGVLGPNGHIYCMPKSSSDDVKVVDPVKMTVASINTAMAFNGAVLGPNGHIYCIPYGGDGVMKVINTSTNGVIANISLGGYGFRGGVLGPNGYIYCMPYYGGIVKVINTSTNMLYTSINSGGQFYGGVLGPNGLIYCISRHTGLDTRIINPSTNQLVGTINDGYGSYGGVLGPNGLIYRMPFSGNTMPVIDTSSNSVLYTIDTGGVFYGGVLGPNGLIYCMPTSGGIVKVINPTTNKVVYSIDTGGGGFYGGVLGQDGRIYCIPYDNGDMKVIDTGTPIPLSVPWMMEAYYNKF